MDKTSHTINPFESRGKAFELLVLFGFYLILFAVQWGFVRPLELQLVTSYVSISSLLFLPHAARVLGAWLLGPVAALALIPAHLLTFHFFIHPLAGAGDIGDALAGALCAPLAFELMRLLKIDLYPRKGAVISWRNLIFAGAVASVFNSFFGLYFISGSFPMDDVFDIIARRIIGDIMGLIVCMAALSFLLKLILRKTHG